MKRLIPFRRRLARLARKAGLPRVSGWVDPGARVRLWDEDWNLIADSDRGDPIPAMRFHDAIEGCARVTYEPATAVRVRR